MSRSLTLNSNLDALRKEAKRWLKSIEAGEAFAMQRFRDVYPGASPPKLREVQQALAREFGLASWAALKQEIEDRARSHSERVELFLEKGVHRYGTDPRTRKWGAYERDGAVRGALAARLLARYPEIARENIHTAVLAHDLEAVRDFLVKDPALASEQHPFDGWMPLMRLAYARLPLPSVKVNTLPIATALLDAGANVSGNLPDYTSGFTALTGVIGEGEGGQSPHPQAEAFARLLIARGADPVDGQALYNTSLGEDDTFWLELMWAESEKRGETAKWRGANPNLIGPPLDYLLGNAVPNHPKRAAWLLEHGALATANNAYSKQPVIKHAVLAGRQDVVELLVRHGAEPPELSDADRLLTATVRGDVGEIRRLAGEHPEFLHNPEPMFAATRQHRTDIAELLLDLGMSPDVGDIMNFRALHYTTHCGAQEIARLLIARGAEIDPFERRYGGTPLSHANYQGRPEMIAIIAPVSRNIRGLCFAGCIERLRELITENPALASEAIHEMEPPVFCLPDDDDRAAELVELLLSFGANASVRNAKGETPAEAARKRGLEDAAQLLDDAAKG
jgi:ankyrin repeat protein